MCNTQRSAEWNSVYGSMGQMGSQLTKLPLDVLDPWTSVDGQSQPFKSYPEERMKELAENIKENGVIEPICVRPKGTRFEIIAGHSRVAASKIAGLNSIPALVQELDDNQAAILMVDSNLQHREKLLPSEKAWAYKTRLDAIKKTPGRSKNEDYVPSLNYRSDNKLAETVGESARQIQRYIRLTNLIPALLDMVDVGSIKVASAVELSYLSENQQLMLYSILTDETNPIKRINMKQAKELKFLSLRECFNKNSVKGILVPSKKSNNDCVKFSSAELSCFFPKNTSAKAMKDIIYKALSAYFLEDKNEK